MRTEPKEHFTTVQILMDCTELHLASKPVYLHVIVVK